MNVGTLFDKNVATLESQWCKGGHRRHRDEVSVPAEWSRVGESLFQVYLRQGSLPAFPQSEGSPKPVEIEREYFFRTALSSVTRLE